MDLEALWSEVKFIRRRVVTLEKKIGAVVRFERREARRIDALAQAAALKATVEPESDDDTGIVAEIRSYYERL